MNEDARGAQEGIGDDVKTRRICRRLVRNTCEWSWTEGRVNRRKGRITIFQLKRLQGDAAADLKGALSKVGGISIGDG